MPYRSLSENVSIISILFLISFYVSTFETDLCINISLVLLFYWSLISCQVTIPFLNSLIDLIATNIAGDRAAVDPATLTYHENTLNYIRYQQQQTGSMWDGIELSWYCLGYTRQ